METLQNYQNANTVQFQLWHIQSNSIKIVRLDSRFLHVFAEILTNLLTITDLSNLPQNGETKRDTLSRKIEIHKIYVKVLQLKTKIVIKAPKNGLQLKLTYNEALQLYKVLTFMDIKLQPYEETLLRKLIYDLDTIL